MNHSSPAVSLRKVPASIYLALVVGFIGTLAYGLGFLFADGEGFDRHVNSERWRLLGQGCWFAEQLMLSLGLLELARRHLGTARVLVETAGWLLLLNLAWSVVRVLLAVGKAGDDTELFVWEWMPRVVGLVTLAAMILLTIGADAWRRVPIAAVAMLLVQATGYWIPIVGKAIAGWIDDETAGQIYFIAREGLAGVAMLFVAGALAAGGRELAAEPRRAASGFRLAHGALIARLVGGLLILVFVIAQTRSGADTLLVLAAPTVTIASMMLVALGLHRVASSAVDGLPRIPLYLAATAGLWWSGIQLEQVTLLYVGLQRELGGSEQIRRSVELFSTIGPVVLTVGLALAGSAIVAYAKNRGDHPFAQGASGRTVTFVVLSLASIALPSLTVLSKAGGAGLVGPALIVFAAIAGIASLVVLAGLLKQTAGFVETSPGIPAARVVSDGA